MRKLLLILLIAVFVIAVLIVGAYLGNRCNTQETCNENINLSLDPGGLPQAYVNETMGFSIRYPVDYVVDSAYVYQELGPGKDINGIKFIIPVASVIGTNLSSFDTGVSVEEISSASDCNASIFVDQGTAQNIIDNNVNYSVIDTTGAAAGNLYEEKVWAIIGTSPCTAVRYFIHSSNIGNYTPGTLREFDHQALINQFDTIRHSLRVF